MKAMLVIFIFSCILLNLGQAKKVSEIQFPLQSGELNGRMVIKDQKWVTILWKHFKNVLAAIQNVLTLVFEICMAVCSNFL